MYGRPTGVRQAHSYGTEDDPLNCSFFLRMGACRHGENCPKRHPQPAFSCTIMFEHLWIAPKKILKNNRKRERHYEDFYEDCLEECLKFGDVEELLVVQNMGDHMIGNCFVRFANEEIAEKALQGFQGRFYAGRKVHVKFSPVQDFAHSRCNDFRENRCLRGQYCNFAHYCPPPRWATKYFSKSYPYQTSRKGGRGRNSSNMDRREFPIRGTSAERRSCIEEWNRERESKGLLKTFEPDKPKTSTSLNLYVPGQA